MLQHGVRRIGNGRPGKATFIFIMPWYKENLMKESHMYRLTLLLPVLALAACTTPETKVRNSLMKAGLSEHMASCMAGRMVDRLSMSQLRRLSSLSAIKQDNLGKMTLDELIYRTRALQDPEMLRVVTASGFRCAIVN